MALTYAFNPSRGETPESIKRKRDLAQALLAARGAPKTVGEGLNSLGDGIVAAVMNSRAEKGETAGMEGAQAAWGPIAAALGGGEFPEAPAAPQTAGSEPADYASQRVAHAHGGGLDGYLSNIRSAESGGNDAAKNPLSSATGRYQFTTGTWADVARAHPDLGLTPEGRLDPDQQEKAIRAFTQDNAGILSQAGIPITGGTLYGAHFLGSSGASKVFQSDPGLRMSNVVDPEVIRSNPFLAGMTVGQFQQWAAKKGGGGPIDFGGNAPTLTPEMIKASVASGALPSPTQGAPAVDPTQVASLDPSIGLPSPGSDADPNYDLLRKGSPELSALPPEPSAVVPPPGDMALKGDRLPAVNQVAQAVMAQEPQQTAPALPAPTNVADRPVASPAVQQVAQALQGPTAEEEIFGPAIDRTKGPSQAALVNALSNPFLPEHQRRVAEALLEQQMQQADPMRQLQMEKLQRELNAPVGDPFSLSPGEIRYDASGKEIARGGEKPLDKPSAVQEYEYAKSQGFPGTFQDWESSKKGGMSLQVDPATGAVTFQQGGNIKPMTEGQSKDTVFATKASGALPTIDKHGDALTSFGERAADALPGGVGNYLKSEEYQKAEQAGMEFMMAILRKETGAAITDSEMRLYGDLYLPRPGDKPGKLTQKKEARKRALEAIKAGMPPQGLLYMENALKASSMPKEPVEIDGYTIEEVE